MINTPPLVILNEQEEIDRYLKTTGNFVRLAELKDIMRSHPMAILLIDRSEVGFREAFDMLQLAIAVNGGCIDVQVRDEVTNN